MRFEQTAVFCDLDGTLFDHTGCITCENREAISWYTHEGGLFAIATGRCPSNMMEFLDGVAFNAPSIVLNGAAVWERSDDRYLFTAFADREAIAMTVRHALGKYPSINIQVYTKEGILYVSPFETINRPFWELHRSSQFVAIEEAERDLWFKSLLFGTPQELEEICSFIRENGLDRRFDMVFASTDIVPGSYYLELLPKDINKGSALKACRSMEAFRGRILIAAGDYNNDLEMVEEADIGACPANGLEKVQKAADWILPTNNDHAIAALIRRIKEDQCIME